MKKSTKQHWNTYWQNEEHDLTLMGHNQKLLNIVCNLGELPGKVILEVGTGTGRDCVHLAKMGASVYAMDYSAPALELVKKFSSDPAIRDNPLLPVAGDAFGLPFPDNSVDIIFHQGFLEHFRNPETLLKEQNRVLKPGGYVVIDVPQKYTLYSLKKHISMWRGLWFAGWETEFSPAELEQLVIDCGFDLQLTYGWGMALSYGWTIQKLVSALKSLKPPPSGEAVVPAQNGSGNNRVKSLAKRAYLYMVDSVGVVARKK